MGYLYLFLGLLEEVAFQATPTLSFGDGGRVQMFRETVPDNWSSNMKTSVAESISLET